MNAVARVLARPVPANRAYVFFEALLLLAPSSLLLGLALAIAARWAESEPFVLGCTAFELFVILLGQAATWLAILLFLRRGESSLVTLPRWISACILAGALFVAAAGLAYAFGFTGIAPFAYEWLHWGLLGIPGLIPAAHLLAESRKARRVLPVGDGPKPRAGWAIAVSAIAAVALLCLQWSFTGPRPFDRAVWDATEKQWDDRQFRRHRMADWLLLTGQLKGRARNDVVKLLGEPPPSGGYFRDWSMVYNLGAERGFVSIDSEWLVLRLDANDRVIEAELVRD